MSRGAAVGDVDNDGDPDVVVVNNAGPARLLSNRAPAGPWLGVRTVAGGSDAIGARVLVGAGRELWRRVHTDGGFASAHDPRLSFGLGGGPAPARLRILWPGGGRREWRQPPTDRYLLFRR